MRAGEIPLWNPLSGTGEPWLANGQAGVFYPPNLLFLIPSPALAAGLYLLLHFAIAVWGARRFLKEENVSDAGSLFGAAAFAACGFAASLSAYWNHFGAFAYLPAIAAVARTGLRSRASMLGLAALVGLQAMAGSPEMTFASIALAVALALAPRREFPDPIVALPRAVSVRRLGAGLALGLALAAWVLVPMAELVIRSDRRHPLAVEARDFGALSAPAARSARGVRRTGRRGRVPRLGVHRSPDLPGGGRGVRGRSPPPARLDPGGVRVAGPAARDARPPGAVAAVAASVRPRALSGEVARLDRLRARHAVGTGRRRPALRCA